MKRILLFLLMPFTSLTASSYPYITGDTFKAFANHVFDEQFDPQTIEEKQTIFVKADSLDTFFTSYHPHISTHYILITHNSDYSVPGAYAHMLDDPKLIAWFGQNVSIHHPKLHPIPIGIANQQWPHGTISLLKKAMRYAKAQEKRTDYMLYMNMALGNNWAIRKPVYDLFAHKSFCFNAPKKDFESYLKEMARFYCVLSPEGNGLDCHRTWEALYMGCIPIVKSHSLNQLYEDLPVIIVSSWEEVTEEFLRTKIAALKKSAYNFEKLYADFWFNKINEVRN